jgi:hypothetical protein
MKFSGFVLTICFYLFLSPASAQEITYEKLFGNWEYKSPKGKSTLTYDLTLEKKFVCLTEHKAAELKTEGSFTLDKKGGNDRLVLNTNVEGLKTKTHTSYHFIKFMGPDTLKVQQVNDRQEQWRSETRKNTMLFVRKKEKA